MRKAAGSCFLGLLHHQLKHARSSKAQWKRSRNQETKRKRGNYCDPGAPPFFSVPHSLPRSKWNQIEYALALTKKVLVDCLASYSRRIQFNSNPKQWLNGHICCTRDVQDRELKKVTEYFNNSSTLHVYIVSLHCIQRVRGRDGTPTQPFWRPTELRLHFHIFLRPKRQSLDVTWESHGIGVIYCDCQNPNCLSLSPLRASSTF